MGRARSSCSDNYGDTADKEDKMDATIHEHFETIQKDLKKFLEEENTSLYHELIVNERDFFGRVAPSAVKSILLVLNSVDNELRIERKLSQ
jgi:hypothetical protein